MPTVIHLHTTVQTVFAVLEDGNAVAQEPITCQVGKFCPEAFTEAHDAIAKERDRAAKDLPPG